MKLKNRKSCDPSHPSITFPLFGTPSHPTHVSFPPKHTPQSSTKPCSPPHTPQSSEKSPPSGMGDPSWFGAFGTHPRHVLLSPSHTPQMSRGLDAFPVRYTSE